MKKHKRLKKMMIIMVSIITSMIIAACSLKDSFLKAPANVMSVKGGEQTLDIVWKSDANSDRTALFVKAVDSLEYYYQIDIGSPISIMSSGIVDSLDQSLFGYSKKSTQHYINATFPFMDSKITADSVRFIQRGKFNRNKSMKIGTIGGDFFEHRYAIFDFKNSKLKIYDKPPKLKNKLIPIEKVNRWVMIPAMHNGDEKEYMWDTGTSAFGLVTKKSIFEEMRDENAEIENFKANSWGKKIDVYRSTTSGTFSIGDKELNFSTVSYMEGFSIWIQIMMYFSGMDGMIGNKVFENNIIYLDMKNQKFAILE